MHDGAWTAAASVLKSGTRPTAPGRRHDGTCLQDWEDRAGSANLDECNGGEVNGRYVYFATDSFPFFPRCHWGEVSRDLVGSGGGGQGPGGQGAGPASRQRPSPGGPPPRR